jgi:hypothetical protein
MYFSHLRRVGGFHRGTSVSYVNKTDCHDIEKKYWIESSAKCQ